MNRKPIIESSDLPEDIIISLGLYYRHADHREIPNNSFTQFPFGFDMNDMEDEDMDDPYLKDILQYFFSMGVKKEDGYVIIHWDW